MALFALVVLMSSSANASATNGIDVPVERIANALGVSESAAAYILALMFLAAISIAASVVGMKIEAVGILMVATIGLFVFIGWMDLWVLVLGAFLVVVMFLAPVAKGITG